MPRQPRPRTRLLTALAQDPSILRNGRVLTTRLDVPFESTKPGPRGSRIHVVDYDTASGQLYAPLILPEGDPFDAEHDWVSDPQFHQQNVYAITMSTLARFEHALGRRVGWGFPGHTLRVVPHAFADANAFYAPSLGALLFGSFQAGGETVHTCLSHDIVVHETTHALLDGLRHGFSTFVSEDQPAFHEGFADIVALLSVVAQVSNIDRALDDVAGKAIALESAKIEGDALSDTFLLKLGEQMGQQLGGGYSAVRGDALRQSVRIEPGTVDLAGPDFQEPHRRGEVLVAAVMNAFLAVWRKRLGPWLREETVERRRVTEEGAKAADRLLTILIRALDYTPPIDLSFDDFLSAVLTADAELWPDDSVYSIRETLRDTFARYGIVPVVSGGREAGMWAPPPEGLTYDAVHAQALREDPNEVMRFVWENRKPLELETNAATRVLSVRPCVRVGVDGFVLRETVAEVLEVLRVEARDLPSVGMQAPADMPPDTVITLHGGKALIFDEFGMLKYDIGNGVAGERQQKRIEQLWERGQLPVLQQESPFARLHLQKLLGTPCRPAERW